MQRSAERRFDVDDLGEIIELASRLDDVGRESREDGFTSADVHHLAGELGIDPNAVSRAIKLYRRSSHVATGRKVMGRAARALLQIHGVVYAAFVGGIGLIDLALGGGFDVVQYPAIGWGTLLTSHAGVYWVMRRSRHQI
jgi:hypothetical protein